MRQFARDVPTMIRINGEAPSGDSDEDKIRNAYFAIVRVGRCIVVLVAAM